MTDFANLTLAADTRDLPGAVREIDRIHVAGRRAEGTANRLAGSVDRLDAEAKALSRTARSTGMGLEQMGRASQTAANNNRVLRGQLQNVSFQLQDVVTQIQLGTSPIRALSVQLPQLLGGFGAVGAAAGLAVGVFGGLAESLIGASGKAEKFEDALESLAERLSTVRSLTDEAQAATEALFSGAFDISAEDAALRNRNALLLAQNELNKAMIEAKSLGVDTYETIGVSVGDLNEGMFAYIDVLDRIVKVERRLLGLNVQQRELASIIRDATEISGSFEDRLGKINELIDRTLALGRIEGVDGSQLDPFLKNLLEIQRSMLDLKSAQDEVAIATANIGDNASDAADQLERMARALAAVASGRGADPRQFGLSATAIEAERVLQDEERILEKAIRANAGASGGRGLSVPSVVDAFISASGGEFITPRVKKSGASSLRKQISELERFEQAQVDAAIALGRQEEAIGKTERELTILNAEYRLQDELIRIIESDGKAATSAELARIQDVVNAYGKRVGVVFDLEAAHDQFAKEQEKRDKAALDAAEEIERAYDSMVDGMSRSFGDFFANGLTGFKDFGKSLLRSFQGLISDLVTTAARQKIVIPVLTAAGVLPGPAVAGGSAAPGGVLSGGGGILSSVLGAGSSFLSGAGSVVSGLLSGGLSGAGTAITTALSGATAGIAGFAAAAGAVALPLLAAVGIFKFFTGSTKELNNGLRVTVKEMDATVETFRTLQKKKFFGLSKKIKEEFAAAGAKLAAPVQDAIRLMQQSVIASAQTLGFSAQDFKGFKARGRVGLSGKSPEQAQERIEKFVTAVGNQFARMVPTFMAFKRVGEGDAARLARVANNLIQVNSIFDALNLKLQDASIASGRFATRLVDALGGLDAFNQAMDFFVQNFYTAQGQLRLAERTVSRTFEALGREIPASIADFRRLTQKAIRNGNEGMLAALLQVAPAFKAIEDAAKAVADERLGLEERLLTLQGNTAELRRRELAALDPANRSLLVMIHQLEDAKAAFEALNPEDFASRFDFRKAEFGARAANSNSPPSGTTGFNPSTAMPAITDKSSADELKRLREELRGMRSEQVQIGLAIQKNTRRTRDILTKFDADGLPAERTA